jgi:hypothetical protein
MTFDGFFSFFLSGLLFLAEGFFDGSIVLFVIELAEVIRFSLHALGDLLFYNSNLIMGKGTEYLAKRIIGAISTHVE